MSTPSPVDNKAIDLEALLTGLSEEKDSLKDPMAKLGSIIFQGDMDGFEALAFMHDATHLLPTQGEREFLASELANHTRKKKSDIKVVIAAKDFRNYPNYSLQEEDDFL